MPTEQEIKKHIKQEYIESARNPLHFFKKYTYIQHPTRGRILFNTYPFQDQVFKLLTRDQNSIIVKSRQMGISTLAAAYILWLMIFHSDKNILCIATTQNTAKNLVQKVIFMYENLPSWLKVEYTENNKLGLTLANGSKVKAVSSSSDSARSEGVSLLVMDEFAFIDNARDIWAAALPTLSTGGKSIILSSPNGTGNLFHEIWTKAETGENGFIPIKLPWDLHPERDQAWRKQKDEEAGDPRIAAQEYDCVFNASGDTVFYGDFIDYYEQNFMKEPLEKRGIDRNLWVWENADYTKQYILCLPPGEKVLSNRGLQNIEDITYEDKLIDRNGDYTDVLDIKRRHYSGKLYEIQPTGTVRTTKFTDEHPILVSKHISKEIWYKNPNNMYRRKQELDLNFEFKDANLVEKGDWIKYPNIYYNKQYDDDYFLNIYKPYLNEGRIDFQNTYDRCILEEDFWWFIGIWLAEGWTYVNKNGYITIHTCHNSKEEYIHERISNLVKKLFGRQVSIILKDNGDAVEIKFNNKGLGNFLYNNFNKYAQNKSIPEWVKFLPDNLKVSLIHGYLEGDGCSLYNKVKNNITLNFVSISLKLLEDFQEILFSLGVCSTVNKLKEKGRIENILGTDYICKGSYSLIVNVWDTNIFLSKINPLYKNNPKICRNNTLKHVRKLKKGCFLSDDNKWIYFKIQNIKIHDYDGIVCNFTTSNTNTFLCKNITTHNCADVARGDGKDYSTAQVLDIEANKQVAEYRGKLGTKEFAHLLTALATEYNEAMLVVENANIGWSVVQTIQDIGYSNLYYTPKQTGNWDDTAYYDRYASKDGMTPGFTTSLRTRPIMIGKYQEYFNDRSVIIQSKRLIDEMKVFVWKDGRAEAATGYNDDLVMAFAIAMYIRDTALMDRQRGIDITKQMLNSINVNRTNYQGGYFASGNDNPYNMSTQWGDENFKWLL